MLVRMLMKLALLCSDVTDLCKAKFLSEVGKKTPILGRWSTVTGESGFPDTARDPRGFSIKFYTEEGNWDMVGNNTPVFFVRDAMKFPDLIHSQKRNPATHMKDPNAFWDFLSLVPESLHQVTSTTISSQFSRIDSTPHLFLRKALKLNPEH